MNNTPQPDEELKVFIVAKHPQTGLPVRLGPYKSHYSVSAICSVLIKLQIYFETERAK